MKKQLINVIESGSIFCYNYGNWNFAKASKYPKLFKNLVNNAILARMDYYKDCMDAEEQVMEEMEGVAWVENLTFKDQGLLLNKLYVEMNAPYDENESEEEIYEDCYMESMLQWVLRNALLTYFEFSVEEDSEVFWLKTSKLWAKVLASGLDMLRIDIRDDILDDDFSWFEFFFYDTDFEMFDTSCEDNKKYCKSLKDYEDIEIDEDAYVNLV